MAADSLKWGCAKMVVIRYQKMGLGAFIGEEEMLGCWGRVFNRAAINLDKDFSYKLFRPADEGEESEDEYLVLNTPLKADKVESKIAELFPDWITVCDCFDFDDLEELIEIQTRNIFMINVPNFKLKEGMLSKALDSLVEEKMIIAYKFEDEGIKVAQSSILSNTMCDIIDGILVKNDIVSDFQIVRKKLMLEFADGLVWMKDYLEEKAKETKV